MSIPDKTPEPDKMYLQNLSANILLNGERLNDIFFKRSETRQQNLTTLFNIVVKAPVSAIRQEKREKKHPEQKRRSKTIQKAVGIYNSYQN